MARFRFPLERLLRLRSQQAQQARLLLQHLAAERQRAEEQLRQLLQQRDSVHDGTIRTGSLSAGELQELWAHCLQLSAAAAQQEHHCQQLRELEGAQHAHFREARKAEEILLRLRQRHWSAFLREEQRSEQKQSDEVAQRRYRDPWHNASP